MGHCRMGVELILISTLENLVLVHPPMWIPRQHFSWINGLAIQLNPLTNPWYPKMPSIGLNIVPPLSMKVHVLGWNIRGDEDEKDWVAG